LTEAILDTNQLIAIGMLALATVGGLAVIANVAIAVITLRAWRQPEDRLRGRLDLSGLAENGDIVALAFLVLMAAARSSEEDLKAIMAGVNDIKACSGAGQK
jgi:hypothetical protein